LINSLSIKYTSTIYTPPFVPLSKWLVYAHKSGRAYNPLSGSPGRREQGSRYLKRYELTVTG